MDIPWAIKELQTFLAKTRLVEPSEPDRFYAPDVKHTSFSDESIAATAQVVERILARVIPDWRQVIPDADNARVNKWCQHREAAIRAKAELERQEELDQKMGDDAPDLKVTQMHAWIWDGARSLWQSGHYRSGRLRSEG